MTQVNCAAIGTSILLSGEDEQGYEITAGGYISQSSTILLAFSTNKGPFCPVFAPNVAELANCFANRCCSETISSNRFFKD